MGQPRLNGSSFHLENTTNLGRYRQKAYQDFLQGCGFGSTLFRIIKDLPDKGGRYGKNLKNSIYFIKRNTIKTKNYKKYNIFKFTFYEFILTFRQLFTPWIRIHYWIRMKANADLRSRLGSALQLMRTYITEFFLQGTAGVRGDKNTFPNTSSPLQARLRFLSLSLL